MSIRSYQDLEVWRKSVRLVKTAYDLAAGFPSNERYGLVSQIQRCAVVGRMLNGLMNSIREKSLEPGTRNLEPA